jgi:hypothetical protein
LDELMKLGPTATNDQDDNERPARYLERQPGSKEEQVNGFVNMVMRRIKKGCSVCHVLHSAGPAHNLERIFYAILRLKAGRSEIVATTSVGELFEHQIAESKATSEPIVACTHLSAVTSQTASSKARSATGRLEQDV